MAVLPKDLVTRPANLTPAMALALRALRAGGELVPAGVETFTAGAELISNKTAQALVLGGFVSRPRDLFENSPNAGRITARGLAALAAYEKGWNQ